MECHGSHIVHLLLPIGSIVPDFLDLCPFERILEPGKHSRSIPDHVGSIQVKYQPKPKHMALIQTTFHDIVSSLTLFNLYVCFLKLTYVLTASISAL